MSIKYANGYSLVRQFWLEKRVSLKESFGLGEESIINGYMSTDQMIAFVAVGWVVSKLLEKWKNTQNSVKKI